MSFGVVAKYSPRFKAQMVRRMVGPNSASATQLAHEVGVSQSSLSNWLKRAAKLPTMPSRTDEDSGGGSSAQRRPQDWPPSERLAVVLEARTVSESDLGAFLRRKGLHEADLNEWRRVALEAAEAALAEKVRGGAKATSLEGKRIKDLEKELKDLREELGRTEKALAKVTALMVLKKKVEMLDGVADDDEPGRSGR